MAQVFTILVTLTCVHVTTTQAHVVCMKEQQMALSLEQVKSFGLKTFHDHSSGNYSKLLLDPSKRILYVGAREAVFALNAMDITMQPKTKMIWEAEDKRTCMLKNKPKDKCENFILDLTFNNSQLIACGTNAFNPKYIYIDQDNFGRNLTKRVGVEGVMWCPHDPTHSLVSLVLDNVLYVATQTDFWGYDHEIARVLGGGSLATDSRWLDDPDFIGAIAGKEAEGDDEKIYFFFTEVAKEVNSFEPIRVARVARICKGDRGGKTTLQGRWTSFLKARLTCKAQPGDNIFSNLRDVFLVATSDDHPPMLIALFSSNWLDLRMSVICAYKWSEVSSIFSGNYKHRENNKWTDYAWTIAKPRPGSCISEELQKQNITSSWDLPEETLSFLKTNTLMSQGVNAVPLLCLHEIYTKLVVASILAANNQNYTVYFLGTDNGKLQKVVKTNGGMYICYSAHLFASGPIKDMKLSACKDHLYASGPHGVVQLSMQGVCSRYKSCEKCVLARDPHCSWDVNAEQCTLTPPSSYVLQDVENGNVSICPSSVELQVMTIGTDEFLFLPCNTSSESATVQWKSWSGPVEVGSILQSVGKPQWLLKLSRTVISPGDQYECWETEIGGVKKLMARYELSSPQDQTTSWITTKHSRVLTSRHHKQISSDHVMTTQDEQMSSDHVMTTTRTSLKAGFQDSCSPPYQIPRPKP
uniref:semaphorin-4E-like isoform X2 n=1 Tax=Myxine glutinosa TaxID=7769 RepID=UPI00358E49A7